MIGDEIYRVGGYHRGSSRISGEEIDRIISEHIVSLQQFLARLGLGEQSW